MSEIADRLGWDRTSAWPSAETIAAALGCSRSTITRALDDISARGWLARERGGFSKSNHYAMAFSKHIAAAVEDGRDERIAARNPATPFGSELRQMDAEDPSAIWLKSAPSVGSDVSHHLAQNCTTIWRTSEPLSYSDIPSSDPEHESKADRLGETEQDETQGHPLLPSESPATDLPEHDDADDQLRIEEETLARLGEGDLSLGVRRAALIGAPRVSRLAARIGAVGVIGAADEIIAAIKSAREIEAKASVEDKAVTT